MKFISFCNFFDSVITNTFKSRRFIFICDLISSCSFLRLFKSRKTKKYSKIKNCRFKWLCIYFIKHHINSRFLNKIIDHWIYVFSDDEKYYWHMIDNQFLFASLMIDSLLWSLEQLSSFDLENDFLSESIEFMINLSNDHFEHLCRFESLTVVSKSSMNVLKEN